MAAMTNAELLTLCNEALQAVLLGQSYEIGGRKLTRADIGQLRTTIEWLERRIAFDADKTGGLGVVTFREAQ